MLHDYPLPADTYSSLDYCRKMSLSSNHTLMLGMCCTKYEFESLPVWPEFHADWNSASLFPSAVNPSILSFGMYVLFSAAHEPPNNT